MDFITTIWDDENCSVEVWDYEGSREVVFSRDDVFFSLTEEQMLEILRRAREIWK